MEKPAHICVEINILGLVLHDHLIIGKSRELSFRSDGYL